MQASLSQTKLKQKGWEKLGSAWSGLFSVITLKIRAWQYWQNQISLSYSIQSLWCTCLRSVKGRGWSYSVDWQYTNRYFGLTMRLYHSRLLGQNGCFTHTHWRLQRKRCSFTLNGVTSKALQQSIDVASLHFVVRPVAVTSARVPVTYLWTSLPLLHSVFNPASHFFFKFIQASKLNQHFHVHKRMNLEH